MHPITSTIVVKSNLLIGLGVGLLTVSIAAPQHARAEDRILIRHHAAAQQSRRPVVLRNGQTLRRLRTDPRSFNVVAVPSGVQTDTLLRELRARPDVEFAVLERRRHAHRDAGDTYFAEQWFLQNNVAQPAAIAANLAWDINTGSNGVIIAVLDTGVRFDHPDLYPSGQQGKLLPGFDFVGNTLMANDGDGWDSDPSDPGDWISQADLDRSDNFFDGCGDDQGAPTSSSWHGTRVAGMIAARSNTDNDNNGSIDGIAGVSWGAYILPVRVMGKCGGNDGDIIDGMRWAAGIPVSGAPVNPYPAKIINMSLGAVGACTAAYQNVIAELNQLGVAVVISAGNDGGPVNEPANCPGAIAVTGLRHIGTKVGFSSLGPEISISAPAGNCVNLTGPCLLPLITTSDFGTTNPAGPGYEGSLGTSFSAPLVSGVIALMRSVNDSLSANQLRARLETGAQSFPINNAAPMCRIPSAPNDLQLSECNCTTSTCGAGMLNANTAIQQAQRPIAFIAAPASVSAGATFPLDGSSSSAACGRTVASYSWSVVSATGTASPVISSDTEALASVHAPTAGSFTLRLTVTDDQGAIDSADISITPTSATTTSTAVLSTPACPVAVIPPTSQPIPGATTPTESPPPKSDGGGGGSLPLQLFAVLAALLVSRHYFSRSFTNAFKY
jgi:serine protease